MRLPVDARVDALTRLYALAEARLTILVQQALASGAIATARYRADRLAAVQQALAELQAEAVPEATQILADSYILGTRLAGVAGNITGTGVHQHALDVLADNLTSRLNDAAEHVGRHVDDVFRRATLEAAALQLIEGSTRRGASARLEETLRSQGVKAFRDRAGREWGLANYAQMAARTVTREAVSHGTRNRLLETGLDLVEVSRHRHERDQCTQYEGKTFSLTGRTDGYPVLDQLPPFHPNCVHVLTGASANLGTLERELGLVAA